MDFLSNINIQFYIAAYLIGGIPFGMLLAKYFAGVNITESGSKSIGATNVLRVVKEENPALAKKLGIATVLLDAVKGVVVLAAGTLLGVEPQTMWAIAVIAVLGHCFSPYLMFEGGKGVATGVGVLMYMLPIPTLISLVAWFVLAKTVRISSVSSLGALLVLVLASYILYPDMAHSPVLIIAFIIFYKHHENIMRLIKGEESRAI